MTIIMMIASIVALVALIALIIGQYKNQKEMAELATQLTKLKGQQEHFRGETTDKINGLADSLVGEVQSFSQDALDEMAANLNHGLQEAQQMLQEVTSEIVTLETKVAQEFDGLVTWKNELEKTMGIQVENQGVFVEFVQEQLAKFANQSQSLPDQLDIISSKLEQIRRLKRELAEVQQPIQLDSWQDERVSKEALLEGAS